MPYASSSVQQADRSAAVPLAVAVMTYDESGDLVMTDGGDADLVLTGTDADGWFTTATPPTSPALKIARAGTAYYAYGAG